MAAHACGVAGCRMQKIVYKQPTGSQVQLVTVGYAGSKCGYLALDADLVEFVDDPGEFEAVDLDTDNAAR